MITIQRVNYKTDNCYIVANGRKAILVDTCSGEAYDTVLAECSKYEMQLVVLTHVHFDHAENAARIAKHFDIPVAYHKADEELFDNFDLQPLMSYGPVGKTVLGLSMKTLRNTTLQKPDKVIYIREGDDLRAYGIPAKILELPGHTKGSIGVDIAGQGLIVGDALDNWISPATGHLYSDPEDLRRSAERIQAMGRRKVYYGHGRPTWNIAKPLAEKTRLREKKDPDRKALIVIDLQNDYLWDQRKPMFTYDTEKLVGTVNEAIAAYKEKGYDIIYIAHILPALPTNKKFIGFSIQGTPGAELYDKLDIVSDLYFEKHFSNTYTSVPFRKHMEEQKYAEVVLCGLDECGCVGATAKGAVKDGTRVYMLENGIGCRFSEKQIQKQRTKLKELGVTYI